MAVRVFSDGHLLLETVEDSLLRSQDLESARWLFCVCVIGEGNSLDLTHRMAHMSSRRWYLHHVLSLFFVSQGLRWLVEAADL